MTRFRLTRAPRRWPELPPADDPDLPEPSRSPTSESASLEHAPADSAAPLPMEDERTVLSGFGLGGTSAAPSEQDLAQLQQMLGKGLR